MAPTNRNSKATLKAGSTSAGSPSGKPQATPGALKSAGPPGSSRTGTGGNINTQQAKPTPSQKPTTNKGGLGRRGR